MENNPFFKKDPFTIRITRNEAISFFENYGLIMDMDIPEKIDNKELKEFFMAAYDLAISKATPSNNKDHIAKIEKLEKEIDAYVAAIEQEKKKTSDLLTLVDEQSANIKKLADTLKDSEERILELEAQIAELNNTMDGNVSSRVNEIVNNFSDNNEMIVLHVSPAERYIINAYAENETKRKNKPISPELLIKGSFFHIIKNGPFDTFSCLFSNSQLSQIINKFKTNG